MIIECKFHVDRAEVGSVPRCGPFCMGFFSLSLSLYEYCTVLEYSTVPMWGRRRGKTSKKEKRKRDLNLNERLD